MLNIKKILNSIYYPIIFISVLLLLMFSLSLIPVSSIQTVSDYITDNINILFSFIASSFIVYSYCGNTKKAITASFCIAMSDLIFYSMSKVHFSFLLLILISYICSVIIQDLELVYGYLVLLLLSAVFAIIVGSLYPYLFELLKSFCMLMKNKTGLFGVVNNIYSVAFSENFAELFYHKDYSSAVVINSEIVSGAKDIFASSGKESSDIVSKYLSGKYFVNIFITIGVFFSLFSKFKENEKTAFLCVCAVALIIGDVRLLSLFLILYNPFVYLFYLMLIFVSYFVARILDIRIGFINEGSLVELFRYGNNWLYFIITGAVIVVLSYFLIHICLIKFDMNNRKYLPKEIRVLVKALGGDKNIQGIKKDRLYVKNPNLVDILKIDCDIHQNEITLCYDDLQLLKQYY